jgi:hypothetical protein
MGALQVTEGLMKPARPCYKDNGPILPTNSFMLLLRPHKCCIGEDR